MYPLLGSVVVTSYPERTPTSSQKCNPARRKALVRRARYAVFTLSLARVPLLSPFCSRRTSALRYCHPFARAPYVVGTLSLAQD
eukprot:8939544-Pyramimonas_sp.AAC.1